MNFSVLYTHTHTHTHTQSNSWIIARHTHLFPVKGTAKNQSEMLPLVIKYFPLFSIMELATVDAKVGDKRSIFVFSVFSSFFLGEFIIGWISFAGLPNKFTDLYRVDGQLCPWAVGTSNGGKQCVFSVKIYLVPVQSIKKKTWLSLQ